jgi:membrane protein CcdC involved in cytochrome C biogenesis
MTWVWFIFYVIVAISGRILATRFSVRGGGINYLVSGSVTMIACIGYPTVLDLFRDWIHIPWIDFFWSWVIGFLCSIPLLLTTRYEKRENGKIYLQRNWSFLIVLVILMFVKFVFREYFHNLDYITITLIAGIFGLGYLGPFRLGCYFKFRQANKKQASKTS